MSHTHLAKQQHEGDGQQDGQGRVEKAIEENRKGLRKDEQAHRAELSE